MSLHLGKRELKSELLVRIVRRLVRNVVIRGESCVLFFFLLLLLVLVFHLYNPLHPGYTVHLLSPLLGGLSEALLKILNTDA